MPSLRLVGSFTLIAAVAIGQNRPSLHLLPAPTGTFSVSRTRVHLRDTSRVEVLAGNPDTKRELNLEVWYPAQSPGRPAPYLPDVPAIKQKLGAQVFKDEFDSASDLVQAQTIATHSFADVPAATGPFPVLIFSHGLGMPSEGYTSQIEDLASRGFVVAAIEHTYDSFVSVFPDGRVIDYEDKEWESRKDPDQHAAYTKSRVDVWASDIVFVLDELSVLNGIKSGSLLSGKLDMQRVGAFGHSMGGLAAVLACQKERRIKSCLDQDSLIYGVPFTHPELPIEQPFMILLTSSTYALARTDAQLARAGISRADFEANIRHAQQTLTDSLRSKKDAALAVLQDQSVEHMSFSDFKILQAPSDFEEQQSASALTSIRDVVSAYFEWSIMGQPGSLKKLNSPVSSVKMIIPAK